ncbi:MAG: sulfide/dihydroorotate dehydrogenase-like FAD/NAD-binding protein [Firmicutes bacterium]|nr:sulfide/dihydroorotate dehydrogenase-like FAD/NAD-binding protein [Bacillota bacterium]
MYQIVKKRILNPHVTQMEVYAPHIAKKALPGQFIILRIDEEGERIPLTVAGCNREAGTVTIIFQKVGYTTNRLDTYEQGDSLLDFVGPLGVASEFHGMKNVAVVGGGLGVAIAYPQAKALHDLGANVSLIVGFRNNDLIILKEELAAASTELIIMTDDGSNGNKGFVTDGLRQLFQAGREFDTVIAIGPLVMMKAVCDITKEHNIRTIVSMNSTMIDGTGMCGCCRLSVGGKTKFACVDGPDFDGHLVDFAEAMARSRMFYKEEAAIIDHHCNLLGGAVNG